MNKDYFSPEQGSAKFNTETKQEGNKFITYYYFLNGFEGNIIKMMNSTKPPAGSLRPTQVVQVIVLSLV